MKKIILISIIFILLGFGINTKSVYSAGECKILSAKFIPSGEQEKDNPPWYKDKQNRVSIKIESENCAGKEIDFTLTEDDSGVGSANDDDLSDSGLENKKIIAPSDNFDLVFRAGEEECEAIGSLGLPGYDCHYYFTIKTDGGTYSSYGKEGGELYYECDVLCFDNWKLLSPINGQERSGVEINASGEIRDDSYTLLAPIGDFNRVENSQSIGDYLNKIFVIALGLAGALAVVMIVINGVLYMGSESIFGKTKAKERIVMSIGGLVLALGAWVILNTINPDLVGGSLGINSVSITISSDDTFNGSNTNLCISKTNPPNLNDVRPISLNLNSATQEYANEINKINTISKGRKLLMIAQTHIEGFNPNTKSYKTKNPGNIGNTDIAPSNWTCSSPGIRCFRTLKEGIQAQIDHLGSIIGQSSRSYKIGGFYDCALNEKYDGSLYQYLRIYSTGARDNNNYLNYIIGYFKQNGVTITARTKMSEINNIR